MSKELSFTTVGGLLPRDFLDRVAAGDAHLPGVEPTSYGLAPGERLNDAITRSWNRLRSLWDSFREAEAAQPDSDQTAATVTRERWLMPLLAELGFAGGIENVRGLTIDAKTYAISHQWGGHVPIHLPGARIAIDRVTRGIQGAASSSPHGVVQEFLNRSEDHLWALLSNGRQLRLLRDNASLTRQAYVEFDLEAIFSGDSYADFVVLWLTCHRTRFEADIPEKCLLEQWATEAASAGTRALQNLRTGVKNAIITLGEGLISHPANSQLRDSLRSGDLAAAAFNHQILRTVYRVLFLLVAENRRLLLDPEAEPAVRARYYDYYSITRIRTLSTQRRGSIHGDLWRAVQLVFGALAHDGEPALGLKPLGSYLWSAEATESLNGAQLDNAHLLEAMRHLGQVRDVEAKVVRNVDYRNLGAEELGSVYESLLELHPQIDIANRRFTLNTAAGNDRKTTGSYYTPSSLINELLDSALEPVLREAARKSDPETAILDLSVLDPACGSGHFLIAAAHRIAHRLASVRADGAEPSPEQVRTALRDVVGRCLHGIDINPMAVELCKVSLWLEAMEPGKPLSFLEHRIVCGNALLGTTPRLIDEGIPDDAYKALSGDDKRIASAWRKTNKTERKKLVEAKEGILALDWTAGASAAPVAEAVAEIDQLPDGTVEQIEAKQARLDELKASGAAKRALLVANAWCAAFVTPKAKDEPPITTATVRQLLEQPNTVTADLVQRVEDLAAQYQFLHVHLAFPDVIGVPDDSSDATNERTGWSGGFDIVLSNPPWDMVQLAEKEWFAGRAPEIAAAAGATRKKLIAALEQDDPELLAAFRHAQRQVDGQRHLLANTDRYPLCGRGKINTYSVFAESMRDAIGPTGHVGVIVPSGIATDDTTKYFFQAIVENRNLTSLFDFENSKPIFPGVHRSYKFCLLTLSGDERPVDEAEFVFFSTDTADLADPERRFTLTPEDFELLNPNTRTCPIFRTRRDAEITKRIYQRVPVLIKEARDGQPEENPWGVTFRQGLFNMTSDSHLFRTSDQLEADGWTLQGNIFTKGNQQYLPLYEAKMIHHFDHRWATYESGEVRDVSGDEKADPAFVVQPRYWVPWAEVSTQVLSSTESLGGWRKTARSTDARTLITAGLPLVGVGDKYQLFFDIDRTAALSLIARMNSFVVDWATRQKHGGTDLSYFTTRQLPIGRPDRPGPLSAELIAWGAQELSETSWDVAACEVEPPFVWNVHRRDVIRAEFDAAFFHVYGIERDDVDYIMDTFPIVRRKDEEAHGEYRTKRLILEIFDEMAQAIESGVPYETRLDPPPADPSLRHDPSTRPDWADLYLELAKGNEA